MEKHYVAVLAGTFREFQDFCRVNKIRIKKPLHMGEKDGKIYSYISSTQYVRGIRWEEIVRIGSFGMRDSDYQLWSEMEALVNAYKTQS